MSKEELIGKLQMTYVGNINALNELIGYYDGLKQVIEELQRENKQLKTKISITEEKYKIFDEINQKYKGVIDKAIKMIDECACYNEKDKECKCSFSSMAMTSLRNILKEVE